MIFFFRGVGGGGALPEQEAREAAEDAAAGGARAPGGALGGAAEAPGEARRCAEAALTHGETAGSPRLQFLFFLAPVILMNAFDRLFWFQLFHTPSRLHLRVPYFIIFSSLDSKVTRLRSVSEWRVTGLEVERVRLGEAIGGEG